MSTARRDTLLAIEKEAQAKWEAAKLHEIDAPSVGAARPPKFFSCFPFPYMNGKLHLGHGFSLTKAEFRSRYQRMKGMRSLWPFGFHVTGTPIAACAQKIQKEMALYGNPPVFPDDIMAREAAKKTPNPSDVDLTKHKSKRGKAAPAMPQWQIMQAMGIPDSEIPKFADPQHWLDYFPPIAIEDLRSFGCHIDFRRSFITTDRNPYFDAFVQWQFRHLRAKGVLSYGKRYCIYSPWDKQPCADHDRASGEGALPQEYTVVKVLVENPSEQPALAPFKNIIAGRDVVLPSATLRPETVYGQTNCWIGPNITYKAYAVQNRAGQEQVFIMTSRAARNMAYQDFIVGGKTWADPEPLFEIEGSAMVGLPVNAPQSTYGIFYLLPMQTIAENKGTGVVMCVPSDSPDDYINFIQLYNKPDYRKKLGVKDEWVMPFPPVPVIQIPELGDVCAKYVCEELKITGPNAADLLAEAKKRCYQAGFYQGVMIAGPFAGKKVSEAKVLTQELLMERDECVRYYEPVRQVTSRSGDECVVALCDQWYLEYGKEDWRKMVEEHVSNTLNTYAAGTKNAFMETLSWLENWPCSRTFGLGTNLPCDATHSMIIDSLSDSTIYMAYYTIARFFHLDRDGTHHLSGSLENAFGLKPEMFTDAVFDHIFLHIGDEKAVAEAAGMPLESLRLMRNEFEYFYPVDIRCSGKDLIQNHLTMFLYNHAAVWPADKSKWPRSIFCNGQILVNGDKMAKSKGNFITMSEAIATYGADPTRLSCADAGDSLDDANFVSDTAAGFIMKLTTIIEQAKELLAKDDLRTGDMTTADRIFNNIINSYIRSSEGCYESMQFRGVLNTAFHEFTNEFSQYRLNCDSEQPHRAMVERFYETFTLLMMPLAPHFAEHMWQEVLKREGAVVTQRFPEPTGPLDYKLVVANRVFMDVVKEVRSQVVKNAKKRGPITEVCVYTTSSYGEWQRKALELLAVLYKKNDNALPADLAKQVMASKPAWMSKDIIPDTMAFLNFVRANVDKYGEPAMSVEPVINDLETLKSMEQSVRNLSGVATVMILDAADTVYPEHAAAKRKCRPGEPTVAFPPAKKE